MGAELADDPSDVQGSSHSAVKALQHAPARCHKVNLDFRGGGQRFRGNIHVGP